MGAAEAFKQRRGEPRFTNAGLRTLGLMQMREALQMRVPVAGARQRDAVVVAEIERRVDGRLKDTGRRHVLNSGEILLARRTVRCRCDGRVGAVAGVKHEAVVADGNGWTGGARRRRIEHIGAAMCWRRG